MICLICPTCGSISLTIVSQGVSACAVVHMYSTIRRRHPAHPRSVRINIPRPRYELLANELRNSHQRKSTCRVVAHRCYMPPTVSTRISPLRLAERFHWHSRYMCGTTACGLDLAIWHLAHTQPSTAGIINYSNNRLTGLEGKVTQN